MQMHARRFAPRETVAESRDFRPASRGIEPTVCMNETFDEIEQQLCAAITRVANTDRPLYREL